MSQETFQVQDLTVAVSVTTTTGRIALPGTAINVSRQFMFTNIGTVPVFWTSGDSAVNAVVPVVGGASGGAPIQPGTQVSHTIPNGHTHVAFITASGTATVYVTPGQGE
jgi:hypothetical protein